MLNQWRKIKQIKCLRYATVGDPVGTGNIGHRFNLARLEHFLEPNSQREQLRNPRDGCFHRLHRWGGLAEGELVFGGLAHETATSAAASISRHVTRNRFPSYSARSIMAATRRARSSADRFSQSGLHSAMAAPT